MRPNKSNHNYFPNFFVQRINRAQVIMSGLNPDKLKFYLCGFLVNTNSKNELNDENYLLTIIAK